MKSKGFVKAGTQVVRRLIMSVDGLEKNGKNHFAFTAPGPLAVISLDNGLDGVVQKFQSDKEIYVAQYRAPIQTGMAAQEVSNLAQAAWRGIATDYREALTTPEIRSVVVDTGTECWETLRLARFGKLTQVMPHHYGPVNAEWRDMVRAAYDAKKHVIFLHKMKDDYINDKRTGEFKRAGMSDMGFLVQVAGRCWKDPKDSTVPGKFHFTITDCRFNPELEGLDFPGEECNFPTVASYILFGDGEHTDEFV